MNFINDEVKNRVHYGIENNENYPTLEIFQYEDLYRLKNTSGDARDSELGAAIGKNIQKFLNTGNRRWLMTMRENYRSELDEIRNDFPNFSDVIDYLSYCAELSWHTDRILRFTPILLSGPGGIGKTRFAERLAEWYSCSFHRIAMAASQNGSELAGSSSFWSNAKPGVIFETLIHGDYANPLVFIDEIDKTSADGRYDSLGALYVLLEEATAINFEDQCYQFPLNASHIMYISACNEPKNIPEPIRTRFKEFSLSINSDQSKKIAINIINSALSKLRPKIKDILFTEQAVNQLAMMTPRRIEQTVLESIGRALKNGTKVIDCVPITSAVKPRIGFLPW